MFAALLLARLLKGHNLRDACECGVATLQSIMSQIEQPEENLPNNVYWNRVELPLIQNREVIESPTIIFRAETLFNKL